MVIRDLERPKTILIGTAVPGDLHYEEGVAKAGEAIMPGMALQVDATDDGDVQTPELLKKNATAAGTWDGRICVEDWKQGKGTGDAIADGDIVPCVIIPPGKKFQGRVAANFNAIPSTALKLAADGTFVAQGGAGIIVAYVEDKINWSLEDVSGFDANDPRAQPLVKMRRA